VTSVLVSHNMGSGPCSQSPGREEEEEEEEEDFNSIIL
jgi:hypothetical protein